MSAAMLLELALPAVCIIVLLALCWIDPAGYRLAEGAR